MSATVAAAPALLSLDDIAELTQYGKRHIQNLVASGRIPQPIRISAGAHPRWHRQTIMKWIDAGCPANSDGSDDEV